MPHFVFYKLVFTIFFFADITFLGITEQLRAKKLLYQISSLYNIILFHQRLEYFIYTAFFLFHIGMNI